MDDSKIGPRRAWPWLVALVPVAAGVTAVVLLGLGFVFNASGQSTLASARERALLLDVHALAAWLPGSFEPDARRGEALRTDYLDRSHELIYVYDDPEDEAAPFLAHSITFESSDEVAHGTFLSQWSGTALGFWYGTGDFEIDEHDREHEPEIPAWGDESKFGVLRSDGQAFGTVFVARSGPVVVYILLAGARVSPKEQREILRPYLERLDSLGLSSAVQEPAQLADR